MPSHVRTPEERALASRIGAHAKWAKVDRVEGTAVARKAFLDRFEREVDPEGILPAAERARRAEHARKAYFQRLALKSAKVRRKPTAEEKRANSARKAEAARLALASAKARNDSAAS